MKATAKLVVDTAPGHMPQGVLNHFQRLVVGSPRVVAQQELEGHGLRELGGRAQAAVLLIEAGG